MTTREYFTVEELEDIIECEDVMDVIILPPAVDALSDEEFINDDDIALGDEVRFFL